MPTKRQDRRPRPSDVNASADVRVGGGVLERTDDVGVMRIEDGRALLAPRAIRDATHGQREAAWRLQQLAADLQQLQVQLQMAVVDARAQGLSWETIGWCVGLTGQAVRKRFA